MLKQAKRKKRSARIAEVKNGYKHVCQLKKMDPNPQLILAFGKL
jgi:hypothetical protein